MKAGALWNTSVIVTKVEQLWELGWEYFPEMMPLFSKLALAIGSSREFETLKEIYTNMPSRNISSHLLQRAPEHVAVMKLEGVIWSDWGQPERIVHTLDRLRVKQRLNRVRIAAAST